MIMPFADTLKKLRTENDLSQSELAERLFITRSTVTRWESGSRMPNAAMIPRIAEVLGADVNLLFTAATQSNNYPNVILVDDRKLILTGSLPILEEAIPNAVITGFTDVNDTVEFAKENRVALAFLDIELRNASGLELCRKLLKINPHTNVVYLTAYGDYALEAWNTGASGFMLKPITVEGVREQLMKLRYPFRTEGDNA